MHLNYPLEKLHAPHTGGIGPASKHKGVEVGDFLDLRASVVEQIGDIFDLAAGGAVSPMSDTIETKEFTP